jgi:hypothetical protein
VGTPDWSRFQALVLAHEELQARLEGVDDWERFCHDALEVAHERGLPLAGDDLEAARREARRSWQRRWEDA